MPTRPGITLLPARSRTFAPSGAFVDAASPIARIASPSITTVWSSRAGAPVPSITRTCVSATAGASNATYSLTASERAGRRGGSAAAAERAVKRSGIAHAHRMEATLPRGVERGTEVGEENRVELDAVPQVLQAQVLVRGVLVVVVVRDR